MILPVAEPDERTEHWLEEAAEAAERGRLGLLARRRPDGHWVGELEGDTILESEFILLLAFLGKSDDPRIPLAANYLLNRQLRDGGWPNYPGGPAEISVTVKAYFALKIAGHAADEPRMQQAREVVLKLGGAEAANSFTRFYLALLGQLPYSACPSVPAEIMLLPRWFAFNIYAMSAWSRTIFVPLSVVDAFKPVTKLPERMHIRELFCSGGTGIPACAPGKPTRQWLSWSICFLGIDWCLKRAERFRLTPLRKYAVRKAVEWIRERRQGSDGLGAIFPPMVYNAIVLRCLGVADDDPEMQWALKQLDDLCIEEDDTLRLQPCLSPVWDTALSLIGLADAQVGMSVLNGGTGIPILNGGTGIPACEAEPQAGMPVPLWDDSIRWLLKKEVRTPGDWSKTIRNVEPGGWFFEYENAFYPDTDDTSMILIALARTGHHLSEECRPAIHRALNWLVAMQNSDGGWGAFDRNINKEILTKVPFADHNAMLDPSCPDITARILESLSHYGYRIGQKPVDRAITFILDHQEENGSWFGRWGVNYIYGTWQVLVGLAAAGFNMHSQPVRRAVHWLKDVQNSDGGWGESCLSYDDPSQAGIGPSTASQTAWAILGLLAAGEADCPAVRAGIEYLIRTQDGDGGWTEEPFTGTGFPRVFYLKYHMYPIYFPLMALGRYVNNSNHQ